MTSPNDALVRELLADLLDDAARLLLKGPCDAVEDAARRLAATPGPHRSAWLKLAHLSQSPGRRQAAVQLLSELSQPTTTTP